MKELEAIVRLTEAFKQFPSIGEKTAERMAYAALNMDDESIKRLVSSLKDVKERIHPCPICGLLTEDDKCSICSSENRSHSTCIVLSNSKDAINFERLETYKGIYHVLGGDISTSKGIAPSDLRIEELRKRIKEENINEIIIATNPTLEGETTALYLARVLNDLDVSITRLAQGIPMGGQIDYADELTISRALEGRTKLK